MHGNCVFVHLDITKLLKHSLFSQTKLLPSQMNNSSAKINIILNIYLSISTYILYIYDTYPYTLKYKTYIEGYLIFK